MPRHLPQALRSRGVVSIWCRPATVLCVSLLQLAGLAGQDSECDAHLYLELYRYIPNDHRHWAEWVVCSTHTTAASAGATGAWMRITTDTFHMAHSTIQIAHSTCPIESSLQPMPEVFWTYARTRYRSIVELILEVDNAVSGLMLISFGSNLYFVCLQLLKSIKWVRERGRGRVRKGFRNKGRELWEERERKKETESLKDGGSSPGVQRKQLRAIDPKKEREARKKEMPWGKKTEKKGWEYKSISRGHSTVEYPST